MTKEVAGKNWMAVLTDDRVIFDSEKFGTIEKSRCEVLPEKSYEDFLKAMDADNIISSIDDSIIKILIRFFGVDINNSYDDIVYR